MAQRVLILRNGAPCSLVMRTQWVLPGRGECSRAGFHFDHIFGRKLEPVQHGIGVGYPVSAVRRQARVVPGQKAYEDGQEQSYDETAGNSPPKFGFDRRFNPFGFRSEEHTSELQSRVE